jgi:hypothetical protein
MHAQYFRTFLSCQQRRRNAGRFPLLHRTPGDRAEHRFAGDTDENRQIRGKCYGQCPKQGKIVIQRLAEAETGINDQTIPGDTRIPTPGNCCPGRKSRTSANDVVS